MLACICRIPILWCCCRSVFDLGVSICGKSDIGIHIHKLVFILIDLAFLRYSEVEWLSELQIYHQPTKPDSAPPDIHVYSYSTPGGSSHRHRMIQCVALNPWANVQSHPANESQRNELLFGEWPRV